MNTSSYDPLNIQLKDVSIGFIFDYDLKTWQVASGNEFKIRDILLRLFNITDGKDYKTVFYNVSSNQAFEAEIFDIRRINSEFQKKVLDENQTPKELIKNELIYSLEKEEQGNIRDLQSNAHDWNLALIRVYQHYQSMQSIYVVQKNMNEFMSFALKLINANDFTNILPKNKSF